MRRQDERWLTVTHSQRCHVHRHTSGAGPIYQGRFKSFPIQQDAHFLTVCRYVERNALRAGLAARVSSILRRYLVRSADANSADLDDHESAPQIIRRKQGHGGNDFFHNGGGGKLAWKSPYRNP